MVPLSEAEMLASANPQAQFIKIDGAGHNDIPTQQLRGLLRGFLDHCF